MCTYLFCRFKFVSGVESKGLATFVGTFSLPALIFGNLCTLDLASMNLKFLLGIFIAKSLVFFAVFGIVALVSKNALGKAGLFAIFVTQSNDFALGYPILKSIYSVSHPEIPNYLYLLAPINLVVLNPLGFIMMEVEKQRSLETTSTRQTKRKTAFRIIKAIITNPIIYMSVLGMIFGSTVFKGRPLPAFMDNFLKTLGNAFSASALFLLGLQMVGRMSQLKPSSLVVPFILVTVKSIVLPLVARESTTLLHAGFNETDSERLSDFAFIYGTIPSAPAVFVFATQYGILPDMIASAMVISTIVSAPIMFISGE